MGCWENDEGGYTCDGACDVLDEALEKKFGQFDHNAKEKNKKTLYKILNDEKLFNWFYNKVKKNFVEHNSIPYPNSVKKELAHLQKEIMKANEEWENATSAGKKAIDKKTLALYDKIEKIEKNYIKYRDMTVREFIGHLIFCLGSPVSMSDVKTPAFVNKGASRSQPKSGQSKKPPQKQPKGVSQKGSTDPLDDLLRMI